MTEARKPDRTTDECEEAPQRHDAAPLEGILVADFSRILAGPLCTMILSDLAATVVKVEHPRRGDDTRAWGPPFVGEGMSSYYVAVNRNKLSVGLDFDDPTDRRRAFALAKKSDVIVENFKPTTMARFGISYADVAAVNSRVVYCSISGFGQHSAVPGYDLLIQAASGFMSITGEPERAPVKAGVAVVDVIAGLHAVIGVLAALEARHRSGVGQQVEVDLFSSALFSLVNQASTYLTTGEIPQRMANRHPSIAPYESFATASEPIAIAAANDEQFAKLCRILGHPEWAISPIFRSNSDRVEHRDELVSLLQESLYQRTAPEWLDLLLSERIPSAPINDIRQAFDLADAMGLEPIVEFDSVSTTANPIHLSSSRPAYVGPPPRLGEHTKEIVAWLDGCIDNAPASLTHRLRRTE